MRLPHGTATIALLVGLAVLAGAPSSAAAHAFGQRYDLALPLGFYLAGAGLAVALSFAGSFLFMRPGIQRRWIFDLVIPASLALVVRAALRTVALFLLALVLATAVAGPQLPTANFATVFVWVIWWVGMVLATALIADLWTPLNPFALLVDGVLRLAGLDRRRVRLPRVAEWLSVLGLLAIAWLELVSEWSEDPRAMAAIIAVYGFGLLAGAVAVGRQHWFAIADPTTRLFSLLGHVAPIAFRQREIRFRLPASGLVSRPLSAAGTVFVVTLIAIVLFDGLSETPFWAAVLEWITQSQALRPWLLELRGLGVDLLKLIRTLGLAATVLLANLLYLGLAAAVWRAAGGEPGLGRTFTVFGASLLPIMVAYHLAHYVSYLVLAGQLVIPILSDPFGLGWNLFGTAGRTMDIGAITAEDVWWIAVAALVTGHALSVFVAHAQALRLYSSPEQAIRSQLPMMVFMVGLTTLSLWILSQPIVE